MHGNTAPGTPAMTAPATSMHGLAASAPDSARVATPASGMAAEVPQVPEMAPRQPLAVVAGSAPRKRRSTTENKENRAVMLPAHGFNAGGKAFRGKQRSRTPARSVGAQQHHAQNLCKTQDGLASWAVEGTDAGSDGQQHYAMGISILAVNGRVSANPSGGPIAQATKQQAANSGTEIFVLANDAGKSHGPGIISSRAWGRLLRDVSDQMLMVSPEAGELASPPVICPRVNVVARKDGCALPETLPWVTRPTSSTMRASAALPAASHDSIACEYFSTTAGSAM
jgi:hypothetical protein